MTIRVRKVYFFQDILQRPILLSCTSSIHQIANRRGGELDSTRKSENDSWAFTAGAVSATPRALRSE